MCGCKYRLNDKDACVCGFLRYLCAIFYTLRTCISIFLHGFFVYISTWSLKLVFVWIMQGSDTGGCEKPSVNASLRTYSTLTDADSWLCAKSPKLKKPWFAKEKQSRKNFSHQRCAIERSSQRVSVSSANTSECFLCNDDTQASAYVYTIWRNRAYNPLIYCFAFAAEAAFALRPPTCTRNDQQCVELSSSKLPAHIHITHLTIRSISTRVFENR